MATSHEGEGGRSAGDGVGGGDPGPVPTPGRWLGPHRRSEPPSAHRQGRKEGILGIEPRRKTTGDPPPFSMHRLHASPCGSLSQNLVLSFWVVWNLGRNPPEWMEGPREGKEEGRGDPPLPLLRFGHLPVQAWGHGRARPVSARTVDLQGPLNRSPSSPTTCDPRRDRSYRPCRRTLQDPSSSTCGHGGPGGGRTHSPFLLSVTPPPRSCPLTTSEVDNFGRPGPSDNFPYSPSPITSQWG